MTCLASQISLLLCFLCFCPGYHVTCALPAFSHRSSAPRTQRTHMHSVTDFPRFCCSICPGTPGGDRSPSRATRPKAWVPLARWPQGPMQVLSVKSDRATRSSNDSVICMSIISIIVIMIIIIIFHRKPARDQPCRPGSTRSQNNGQPARNLSITLACTVRVASMTFSQLEVSLVSQVRPVARTTGSQLAISSSLWHVLFASPR